MIKITINVPWGHGDSPHARTQMALESLTSKMIEVRQSIMTDNPKQFDLEGKLEHSGKSVGSYKVEFGE